MNLPERHIAHHFHPQHDHARGPEEDDVETGNQQSCRIESSQVGGVIRPAQGGEGPEAGAKPGIQHIGFLPELLRVAVRTFSWRLARYGDALTIAAIPRRNAMPPPELARNTPVANVV